MTDFHFDLVSPAEKVLSEPATSATLPGAEGEFGVLPEHAPLIATLKPGVVRVKSAGDNIQEVFIAGGFADVSREQVTVLAEDAIAVKDLNPASLDEELKNLEDDLALAEGSADRVRLQQKIEIVKAKRSALSS